MSRSDDVRVADILETAAEIAAVIGPDLQDEDIREAWRYAAEAVKERKLPLRRSA